MAKGLTTPHRPPSLGQFDSNSFFVDYFAKCLLGKCTMQSDEELLKWKGIRLKNVRNNKNLFITLLLPFSLSLSFSLGKLRKTILDYFILNMFNEHFNILITLAI